VDDRKKRFFQAIGGIHPGKAVVFRDVALDLMKVNGGLSRKP
jgi:hypothetical protein